MSGVTHRGREGWGSGVAPQSAADAKWYDDPVTKSKFTIAQCGHAFHRSCLRGYLEDAPELPLGGVGCNSCYKPFTVPLDDESDDEDNDGGGQVKPPPKAALLLQLATTAATTATRRNAKPCAQP